MKAKTNSKGGGFSTKKQSASPKSKTSGRSESKSTSASFSTKGVQTKGFGAPKKFVEAEATGESFSTKGITAPGAASSTPPVTGAAAEKEWSSEQKAIFKEFAEGRTHVVVEAYAGTGKTTTIVKGTEYLSGNVLLCAFNKRIAEELQHRLDSQPGPLVKAKTLHSLGFSYLQRSVGKLTLDGYRMEPIIRRVYGANGKAVSRDILRAAQQLSTLVKETIGPDYINNFNSIYATDVAYGCTELLKDGEREDLHAMMGEILHEAARIDGTCDFSDMLWLPLVHKCVTPDYDVVIVDEAQDMNHSQLLLAKASVAQGGRIVVVGDPKQAIYGFRGASSDSIDKLRKELKAKTLKLTTTYRCAKRIVKEAQQFVPDFKAWEGNGDGAIQFSAPEGALAAAKPGDFILSRANAPLVSTCIALARAGKRAKVEGKEIGKGLVSILYKLKPTHVTEVGTLADEWARKLTGRLNPDRDGQRIEQVMDQAEVLTVMAEESDSINDMVKRIDTLFADTGASKDTIVCSTVHKAKGLEADRVFMLVDTFKGRKKDGGIPSGEEANIRYVAITRAIKELVYVSKKFGEVKESDANPAKL